MSCLHPKHQSVQGFFFMPAGVSQQFEFIFKRTINFESTEKELCAYHRDANILTFIQIIFILQTS